MTVRIALAIGDGNAWYRASVGNKTQPQPFRSLINVKHDGGPQLLNLKVFFLGNKNIH